MKTFLFAAALAVSIPALAQDMGTTETPPAADVAPPGAAAPTDAAPMGDSTAPATDTTTAAQAPTTQADPAAAPTAPADASTTTGAGMTTPADPNATGSAMANAPAAGDPSTYPKCSRTVKDRCVNRGGK